MIWVRNGKISCWQTIQTIENNCQVCICLYASVLWGKTRQSDSFERNFVFFLFLDEISQQPLPYMHYINIQFVFDDVVLFVVFAWFYLPPINKNRWFCLLTINKLWFCAGNVVWIFLSKKQESEYARYVWHIPILLVGSWVCRRYCDRSLILLQPGPCLQENDVAGISCLHRREDPLALPL